MISFDIHVTQRVFSDLIGVSEAAVSNMMKSGVIASGDSLGNWIKDYCFHLREQAAGRAAQGDIDLVTERALLARSQREGQEIKNAVARGAYAPIELLSDVLSDAAQAVVDQLEQIPAGIIRICPDLPHPVIELVMTQIANARNEMARKTVSLSADLDPSDISEPENEDI